MAIVGSRARKARKTELDDAMGQVKSAMIIVAVFSLVINILMLASPIYMLQVYDRVLVTGHLETLVLLTIMAGVALLVLGLLDMLRNIIMARAANWLSDRLSPVIIAGSVRARLLGDQAGTQPLRDLGQVQSFLSSQASTALFDLPWTPVFLLLIWLLHPALGAFALAATILLVLLGVLNEVVTRKSSLLASTSQIQALQQADMAIRNAEVVRAMGMLPGLLDRFRASNDAFLGASDVASRRGATIVGITKFVRLFVQSATLGLGAYLLLQGGATGGVMIASSILLGRALAPVEHLMAIWRNLGQTRIAYARLTERLQNVSAEPYRIRLPEPDGRITLENVSYFAQPGRPAIIDNLSVAFQPGEAVAIIGPSAGGKSTLCRLIAGIVLPTSGTVRLDGTDVQHWNSEQLGEAMGYLPQDVELFSGSVRDNISRMAKAEDQAVVDAAMLSHAHDMIQRLPQGYETPIGDAGSRLSGGQRQRIGLARAVFGSPRVVVLDEPNANLDQVGESALAAAIAELKAQGTTLIIVGHRPSTLAQADKVLFLRDGRLHLFGPRDEVLVRLRSIAREGERTPLHVIRVSDETQADEGGDSKQQQKIGPTAPQIEQIA
ncbi:type I secretion system permease/ATPase [Mesorhizobium sp. Pch-S]|uniref:type I secretion system permease/ATPase n=1 Tax=Mesorhizobium sp. Pch-S TaxID=2082387 RepID=UPI0010118DBC|nr:type I secretion system permease/ATPase [Mesorhizobium sp. Pch-S]QAZ43431.1 type I secretion system permease/ATPase [Mesorhizobium sp. Pch-S]